MAESDYKIVPSKENDCEKHIEETTPIYGYGARHIQALLYFTCLALLYMSRGHMGVTIVAMTAPPNPTSQGARDNDTINCNNTYTHLDVMSDSIPEPVWNIYKTYDWPKSIQEMVLGSFFFGYCIMMFPFGLICQKFGGKLPVQIALFVSAFISFFTPWLVAWGGWKVLCVTRVMLGISQAGLYPALTMLLSNWVPARERGSLSCCVLTGSGFGTIMAFQISGILGFSNFGWPSTFLVMGILCFIGFLLMTVYGAHNPDAYRLISEEEKTYIMADSGLRIMTKSKTPWKSIVRSGPIWSTFAAHTGSAVTFVFFLTQVPTYMYAILKLNLRNSGLLSSLPYLASFLTSISFGYLSDLCTNKKLLSVQNARKCSNSISSIIPAMCMMVVSYVTDTTAAVICFIVSVATHAAMHTGWMVNYLDLSPNYSGATMALGNTLANIFVTILPIVVSNVVTDVTNQYQWRVLMFLMAGVSLASNLIFVLFLSTETQPWNDDDNDGKQTDPEITLKECK